jgi:uncharacterized protein (TIGR00369 family)
MADAQTANAPRLLLENAIEKSPFTRWVGTRLAHFEPGLVTIEVDTRQELTQHHGFVHGAVVGYMADTVCAWAAASVVGDVVTSEFKINFLSPALGDMLRARGTVIKAGSRQVVVRADVFAIKDGAEKVCATALATIAKV